MPRPSELANTCLREINAEVRPTVEWLLRSRIPGPQFDHFPVDPDDILQIGWLRIIAKEEDRDYDVTQAEMVRILTRFTRNIGRELTKARARRNNMLTGIEELLRLRRRFRGRDTGDNTGEVS